jgi:hypothetical protein
VSGQVLRAPIERQNNYAQAGERFRTMPEWERDDLVKNLINLLDQCDKHIQEKMRPRGTPFASSGNRTGRYPLSGVSMPAMRMVRDGDGRARLSIEARQ